MGQMEQIVEAIFRQYQLASSQLPLFAKQLWQPSVPMLEDEPSTSHGPDFFLKPEPVEGNVVIFLFDSLAMVLDNS